MLGGRAASLACAMGVCGGFRFRPVHRPRPKVVSIPKDYFCSDTPAVRWESLNEAWEVAFVEDSGKRSSKPFPVKKFGVGRAKAEALAFAKLSVRLGLSLPKPSEGMTGVAGRRFFAPEMCHWASSAYLFWFRKESSATSSAFRARSLVGKSP